METHVAINHGIKVRIIVFLILSFSTFSFSQTLVERIQDSIRKNLIKSLSVSTVTTISFDKTTKSSPRVERYDRNGNLIIEEDLPSYKKSYEYDFVGHVTRIYFYDAKDTSKIEQWRLIEYDSAGRVTSEAYFDSNNVQYHKRVTSYKKDGQYLSISVSDCFSPAEKPTIRYERISPIDNNRCILTDHISYDKHDSIKEIRTSYAKYDTIGRLIENGHIDYSFGAFVFGNANPELHIFDHNNQQCYFQMILNRKFEGIKRPEIQYTYDSLGKISDVIENEQHFHYAYNNLGQLIQVNFIQSEHNITQKFEYNMNGLLIHEQLIDPFSEIHREYIYEYFH
ncbi:MAG: hypothetical protein M3Q56_01590 [Bacteroidota bacterium]|nr:hypothetical protein [Bacteroidota bacterium]